MVKDIFWIEKRIIRMDVFLLVFSNSLDEII